MPTQISEAKLNNIIETFAFNGICTKVQPWGNGHINDTFAVWVKEDTDLEKRYILQHINKNVFKKPDEVMANIEKVVAHLIQKIEAASGDPTRETLNIVLAKDGKSYVLDEEGEYWRTFAFVEGTTSYDLVRTPDDFYKSAKAFGKFQKMLEDFPADKLFETIPNFHNTKSRYQDFLNAVENNLSGRAGEVAAEIKFIKDRVNDTNVLLDMLERGDLPLKVTHNDTKLNNVLIDNVTGEGICVIDLDTVMPGLSLYDFGDSIRFGASTALEDETDLDQVKMNIELFKIYVKGFVEEGGDALTPNEIRMLPMGAKVITLEQAMRFLGDHLNGDTYFKVHREGHNLDRARTQIKLVADMEAQWDDMANIVATYL